MVRDGAIEAGVYDLVVEDDHGSEALRLHGSCEQRWRLRLCWVACAWRQLLAAQCSNLCCRAS